MSIYASLSAQTKHIRWTKEAKQTRAKKTLDVWGTSAPRASCSSSHRSSRGTIQIQKCRRHAIIVRHAHFARRDASLSIARRETIPRKKRKKKHPASSFRDLKRVRDDTTNDVSLLKSYLDVVERPFTEEFHFLRGEFSHDVRALCVARCSFSRFSLFVPCVALFF